jgi:GNAT superfamily N-acetyltransferase
MNIVMRPTTSADTGAIAHVVYEAFRDIHDRHRFPRDFPTMEFATQFATAWNAHPAIWGVVAEADGAVVGVNFLNERNAIRGVGPIGVLPAGQGHKVGRRLMEAILERGRAADGIRLVQDAFNMGSLSLYASLGFEVKEPLVLMTGTPAGAPRTDVEVRAMTADDVDACTRLCVAVHGIGREQELRDALATLGPTVAVRDGRIVAYMSAPHFAVLNHGVAETDADLEALLAGTGALRSEPLALLVPTRRAGLVRWGLARGLRAIKPMTLMVIGRYQEPTGAFFPSVEY